jgi:hypothetical protein
MEAVEHDLQHHRSGFLDLPLPDQINIEAPPGVTRGCANLMLRVLLDAIMLLDEPDRRRGIPRYDSPARVAYSRAQSEARRWFESDRTDGPFAFVTICQALNLPEGKIRAHLGLPAPRPGTARISFLGRKPKGSRAARRLVSIPGARPRT